MRQPIKSGLIVFGLALSSVADARGNAWENRMGSESTDSLSITLDLRDQIRISNLRDIYLSQNTDGSYSGGTDACIYRNSGQQYNITARGNYSGFYLKNQNTKLPYAVFYNDGASKSQMGNGLTLLNRRNANNQHKDCNGESNAYIQVLISSHTINSVPAGTYSGILNLVVSPI